MWREEVGELVWDISGDIRGWDDVLERLGQWFAPNLDKQNEREGHRMPGEEPHQVRTQFCLVLTRGWLRPRGVLGRAILESPVHPFPA